MQKSGNASSSMVYDALRKAEEQGIPADSEWMRALKEAAATAFMGICPSLVPLFLSRESSSCLGNGT